MGSHDRYGKRLVEVATNGRAHTEGDKVWVDYGNGSDARIDGYIDDIAIEIESRVSKQVRGAVLDLLCHKARSKVIIPAHAINPKLLKAQCENILSGNVDASHFEVLLLRGTGIKPRFDEDLELVRDCIQRLSGSAKIIPFHRN